MVIQESKHILSHDFGILEFFTSAMEMRKRDDGGGEGARRERGKENGGRDAERKRERV